MKSKLPGLYLAACIALPLNAFATPSDPVNCPGVEAIKKVPFIRAKVDYWVGWIASTPLSKYDTQAEWITGMMVSGDENEDPNNILEKANHNLSLIEHKIAGPDKISGGWWCYYTNRTDNPQVVLYSFLQAEDDFAEKLAKVSARFQRLQH